MFAVCFGANAQQNDSAPGAGCALPKLFVIPPEEQLAGKETEVRAAAKVYFDGIAAYSACVQNELVAAGGEAAPELVRRVLILRNNALVAEADFMMKRYTETLGGAPAAASAAVALPVAGPAAR